MEHTFAVQSILDNAPRNSLPIALTFIDLRNSFGSVSHRYIHDILEHINLPTPITQYVQNLYSSLSAHVVTKLWQPPSFPVKRGVFQGDTLSPLIFLIAFNPVIQSVQAHPSAGYNFKLPLTVAPLKCLSHSLKQTATSMHSGTNQTPMNPQAGTWPRFFLYFPMGLLPSSNVKATPLRT